MTDPQPDRSRDLARARSFSPLRLRLWLACLGGSIVAAVGLGWVISVQIGSGASVDVVSWLVVIAGFALLAGAGLALWLDRSIVVHARGLARSVADGDSASLLGLPASSGWGELSVATRQVEELLDRHRKAESATEELSALRGQLAALRESLDRWAAEERWVELRSEAGQVAPAIEALNRGLRRWDEVREQNLEAARQVATEMERALQAARDSAEQSERGFVEATALLTTVRELQRLGQELAQNVVSSSGTAPAEFQSSVVASARQAIEALVEGSTRSVDQLSRGLARVEEIATQVPVLANRATLVALNSTLEPGATREERSEETRRLIMDIRAAVESTSRLTQELERDVAGARTEMKNVRERVAEKLDAIQVPATSPRAMEDVSRLLDRIREMIQDATRKGERLSATGERASRAAETLTRALETDTREMSGLIARLTPPTPSTPHIPEAGDPGRSAGLRLLGREDAPEERGVERRTPGTGEEPR